MRASGVCARVGLALLAGVVASCAAPRPATPEADGGAATDGTPPFDAGAWRDRLGLQPVPDPAYVSCFGAAPTSQAVSFTPSTSSVWGNPRALPSPELAARLSRFLWGTLPDAELTQKIAACPTLVRQDLDVLVRQMLADDRAERGLEQFFTWWLKLDRIAQIQRDPSLFPQLTPALRVSLATEPPRFGADIIRHGDANLRSLFTAPYTFMDGNLATIYGNTDIPPSAPFQRVMFTGAAARGGVFTQPGPLIMADPPDRNSPTMRAVDLYDRILCLATPPPPSGTAGHYRPDDLKPVAGRTLRQAIEAAVAASPVCRACHVIFDIGFAFERYDALGRVRDTENGAAVDSTANQVGLVMVADALDLGVKAAELPDVAACFARKWLSFAVGLRLPDNQPNASVNVALEVFRANNLDIRALISAITQTALFLAP
ncbi:MAG TPA: DUF1592 domain-containing protein [Polyangia bacterium]|jgi:hypothetical protein|nr:DUF1592 domain-containing protein [Polyangia bacterium]